MDLTSIIEFISGIVIPTLLGISSGCFIERIKDDKKYFWGPIIFAILLYVFVWAINTGMPTSGFANSGNLNDMVDKISVYRFNLLDYFKIYWYIIIVELIFGFLIGFNLKNKKYFHSIVSILIFFVILISTYNSHDYIIGVKYYDLYQEKGTTENYLTLAEESFNKSYKKGYKESALMLGTTSIEKGDLNEAEEYLIIANELGFKNNKVEAYYYYCLGYIDYKKWREDKNNNNFFNNAEKYYRNSLDLYSNGVNVANVALGYLYWEKWEEDKSNKQYFSDAEKYLKESFDQGNLNICYELGYLYTIRWEEDKSNKQYFNDAEKYFKIALKSDNSNLKENAKAMLDYLYN